MQLNPQHLTVKQLLEGRLFRIPEYQRAYSWQRRQREDLFADIREAHRSEREHFMATVVALKRDRRKIGADEFTIVELVDGQQRITTLVMLLKAAEKAIEDGSGADARLKNDIASLLVKEDEHNLVLLQTNHDSSAVFADYIRDGKIRSDAVVTAADGNVIDAAIECEAFVASWCTVHPLADLLFTIRNRLSMIFHEVAEEAIVYRVFEVLNSRGLDVRWIDKTKSQLMATIYDHVAESSRADALKEMHVIWQGIYRVLGLDERHGQEALRFAGTWFKQARPNRIVGDEEASREVLARAGFDLKAIIAAASRLRLIVDKVLALHGDHRRAAVSRIGHARFVAVAIMLRGFKPAHEKKLLDTWERVTFRIYSLAGKDARAKVGDYVRLGYDIVVDQLDVATVAASLDELGEDYAIDDVIDEDTWDNWYEGVGEELRYLLYRYEEHLAGGDLNHSIWNKIWATDPAKSIEHISPQSAGKRYAHNIGNLTMLPPGVNSSLQDKPAKDKAARYQQVGLEATRAVGRQIAETGVWNEKSVLARAALIEAFVREEWGD